MSIDRIVAVSPAEKSVGRKATRRPTIEPGRIQAYEKSSILPARTELWQGRWPAPAARAPDMNQCR
jgi:hypothetical protein